MRLDRLVVAAVIAVIGLVVLAAFLEAMFGYLVGLTVCVIALRLTWWWTGRW